ncbi:MAG: NAD(P)H-hydrate dehydratase [Betaproteobacteria bacterium]|nr:NAD(P)H-hydrate dehydratase [Betaproteobacteria bacterium]
MKPVYDAGGIREIESLAGAVEPPLMARAGLAAAEAIRAHHGDAVRNVLVIAGPGNNGGDALEVAVHLKRWFYRVTVVLAGGNKLPRDAAAALRKWSDAGGEVQDWIPPAGHWQIVVDGLFGIGLQRPVEGRHAELIAQINGLGVPVAALDVPSGINADTGAVMGVAVRASQTITFIALKPGLLTLDGPDHCGEIIVANLGLDVETLIAPRGQTLDAAILPRVMKPRPKNFHKGRAGSVGILGGASGMVGAALLAGRAALKSGAGRVHVGLLAEHPPDVDSVQPELMLRSASAVLALLVDSSEAAAQASLAGTVLLAGPGMGKADAARRVLARAVKSGAILVLDADALNLVAENRHLANAVARRAAATLITPHPAEAARLLGTSTAEVQANRIAATIELARRFNAGAVLKGNGSIVAAPDGRYWINASGNPGMSSAGMGDVLGGIVASLAAQQIAPVDALLAGVYLHGAAADWLVAQGVGPIGLAAGELIDAARRLLNHDGVTSAPLTRS